MSYIRGILTLESWEHLRALAIIIALALSIFVGLSSLGLMVVGLLLLMVFGFILLYKYPMPALLWLLWMYSNMPVQVPLPSLKFSGFEINASDVLLGMLFLVAVYKLYRRKEHPLFLWPLVLFGFFIALSWGMGILAGTADIRDGTNVVRSLLPYFIYFIIVGLVENRRQLTLVLGIVFLVLVFSVGLQAWEALGYQLPAGWSGSPGTTQLLSMNIPYLWNRNTGNLALGLFLAAGCLLEGKRTSFFVWIVLLGLFGFFIAVIRQWFVMIGVSGMVLLSLYVRRRGFRNWITIALVGGALLLGLTLLSTYSQRHDVVSWLTIIQLRLMTLLNSPNEANFLVRVSSNQEQFAMFLRAPILGYGPGRVWLSLFNPDTGFINSLLLFGAVGYTSVIWILAEIFRRGYRLWNSLAPSVDRGYASGLLAIPVLIVIGSLFSQDFITFVPMLVVMVLLLIDRLSYFHQHPNERVSR